VGKRNTIVMIKYKKQMSTFKQKQAVIPKIHKMPVVDLQEITNKAGTFRTSNSHIGRQNAAWKTK
jgi:hypothetical protein